MPTSPARTADDIADNIRSLIDRVVDAKFTQEMAKRGQLSVEIETYSIDEGPKAYERLHEGSIRGRAVILPNG